MKESRSISIEKTDLLEQHLIMAIRLFVESIYAFKEAAFNRVPDKNCWSAAQVGSHINKSMHFIHQAVTDKTSVAQRDPEAYIEILKRSMADMTTKTKSSAALVPSPDFLMRTSMRKELTAAMLLLVKDIKNLDLSLLCDGLKFPEIGCLTRYELISFAAFHIERHTRQLIAIHEFLEAKSGLAQG